jgi:uncharacterized membrane protein YphA (DoxX/SURF4 family)
MTDRVWAPIIAVMKITLVKRLMAFEALTLAVVSPIHLLGGSSGAGIPEGLICIALLIGLARERAALPAVAFAIFGFLVGLRFTIGGGDALDLAYHATMLPLLIATALLLTRTRRRGRPPTARTSEAVSR